jgi:hypothetical protein
MQSPTSSTAGGIFDPAGFSKGDMASLKLKEIKNARLAMLVRLRLRQALHCPPAGVPCQLRFSCGAHLMHLTCVLQAYAGFLAQHVVTDTTPLANLSAHLADPWTNNVVTNELARSGGGLSGFSYIN